MGLIILLQPLPLIQTWLPALRFVFLWVSLPVLNIDLYDLIVEDSSEDLQTLDVQLCLSFNVQCSSDVVTSLGQRNSIGIMK